ncbi:MAG TPA: Wzz/FepE/Etk N-terminal domain-containing protein [Terriglobales bacterium]|nr:Wzz/FepE/Etk N-terminal domain-containing protein [Terriglobales bacterium]
MSIMDTKTMPEPGRATELNGDLKPRVFEHSDGRGFFETISLLWAGRRQIWQFVVAGFVTGVLVALVVPPRYKSTTQLMPPDAQSSSGMSLLSSFMSAGTSDTGSATGADLGSLAGSLLGLKTPGDLFVGVLQSRTVQDELINRFDLRKEYNVKRYETARKKLVKNTEISLDHKSGIISITVYDRHPQRAADMAKEYVAELNVLMAELSTSSARRERIFLEERLRVAKQELDAASKDLAEYSSKNATLDVEDEGKAIVEAAATLEGELIAAQSEVKGLEQIYTSNNVRVKSLHARIAELQRKLNEVGGTKGISVADVGPGSNAQGGTDDFLYPSLRQLPVLGERYIDLYRRAKIGEKVFELLTAQYEMARVQEAKEIPTVKVLDVANFPERRSGPPRTALTMLFTMFFFLIGVVWIVGKRRWNQLDHYSPVRLTVLEIASDVRATKFWAKSEALFHGVSAKLRETGFIRSRTKGILPEE